MTKILSQYSLCDIGVAYTLPVGRLSLIHNNKVYNKDLKTLFADFPASYLELALKESSSKASCMVPPRACHHCSIHNKHSCVANNANTAVTFCILLYI